MTFYYSHVQVPSASHFTEKKERGHSLPKPIDREERAERDERGEQGRRRRHGGVADRSHNGSEQRAGASAGGGDGEEGPHRNRLLPFPR